MNLIAQDPKLLSKLQKYSRDFHILSGQTKSLSGLRKMVILGEGNPDDQIMFLASHQINGTESAAIIKPPHDRGSSAFRLVKQYFTRIHLNAVLFIIDQEDAELDDLQKEIEKHLRKYRDGFHLKSYEYCGRLLSYECAVESGSHNVIMTINGHQEISTNKHMIEDHFILAAGKLNLVKLPEKIDYSKDFWQKSVPLQNQKVTINALQENSVFFEECFPQQYLACRLLKTC